MTTLTVQNIARTGLAPAYAAVAAADEFPNEGATYLHVKNGSGSSINVTVTSKASAPVGTAQANVVVAVPAAGERIIGPFPPAAFNNTNGRVEVAYSAIATVTAAAIYQPLS